MALPVYTVTGSVSAAPLVWNANYAVQTGSVPPVHAAYIQQCTEATIASLTYSNGTGAAQANKVVLVTGSCASDSAPASKLDLTSCTDVSGKSGVTFSALRELWIFNDGVAVFSTASEVWLEWDLSFANAWGVGTAADGIVETGTTPVLKVQNGSFLRIAKPYGAAGWTVDATHKIIALGSPVQAETFYRIIAIGN